MLKTKDEAYEAGKAEGRRLERRAMRRWLNNEIPEDATYWRWMDRWLKNRAKPAKRKEGGR